MPRSLSQLYVRLAFGTQHREPMRWRCVSPLQGFEIEGATLTQAVGLGCDKSPLWGLRQTQMRAFCLHVAENGHAVNKGDENVETPGNAKPLRKTGRQSRKCAWGETIKDQAVSPRQQTIGSRQVRLHKEKNLPCSGQTRSQRPPALSPRRRRRISTPHRARGRWKAGRRHGRRLLRSRASRSGSCRRTAL